MGSQNPSRCDCLAGGSDGCGLRSLAMSLREILGRLVKLVGECVLPRTGRVGVAACHLHDSHLLPVGNRLIKIREGPRDIGGIAFEFPTSPANQGRDVGGVDRERVVPAGLSYRRL